MQAAALLFAQRLGLGFAEFGLAGPLTALSGTLKSFFEIHPAANFQMLIETLENTEEDSRKVAKTQRK
jgi:hypothetical protein